MRAIRSSTIVTAVSGLPDRYRILETVSSDEPWDVLVCEDRLLGRRVVVKRPGPALADARAGEAALREARALARVKHPGVQRLLEVLELAQGPALVLEPVAGETLAARIARLGRLEPEEVARLGAELADALAAVHELGIVHRDVAPGNVVLRAAGGVCLVGFRFAKPCDPQALSSIDYGGARSSKAASPEGLPRYPAPEQIHGEAASPCSDLFGLGSLLYLCLTGNDAFADLARTGWTTPGDPARGDPRVPRELSELVLRCLSRSPAGRPRSALEVRDALRDTRPRPALRAAARRPWLALGVAAGLVLALIVTLPALLWGKRRVMGGEGQSAQDVQRGAPLQARPAGEGDYASGFQRSVALLIGIGSAYAEGGFPPLPNAERDVEALSECLAACEGDRWAVRKLLGAGATRAAILDAKAALERELEPEDRVLVYFAGHGVPHESAESSGWIVPADGRTLERDSSRASWIHFDELLRFFEHTRAKHALVALDCCYGGRITAARSGTARAWEERFTTTKAHVVLASGRPDEAVLDGELGDHSPFAATLVEALAGSGGPVTSSMLHAELLRRFADQGVAHTPVLAFPRGAIPGEFVLRLGPGR